MASPKLFVVVVGGYPDGAHVEVHDVRFTVGHKIEDCFDDLKKQWWGDNPARFHLDAWGPLTWADGFGVSIRQEKPEGDFRLWFVNLGGYLPDRFEELHKNVFVVAQDKASAKKRALAMAQEWVSPHRDALLDVEMAIDINQALGEGQYIWLDPSAPEKNFEFEAYYLPIGKMKSGATEND